MGQREPWSLSTSMGRTSGSRVKPGNATEKAEDPSLLSASRDGGETDLEGSTVGRSSGGMVTQRRPKRKELCRLSCFSLHFTSGPVKVWDFFFFAQGHPAGWEVEAGEPTPSQVRKVPPVFTGSMNVGDNKQMNSEWTQGALGPSSHSRQASRCPCPPSTPMARPPRAMPMALPRSSSSVYTLASMPIPKQEKRRSAVKLSGEHPNKSSVTHRPPSPTQTCDLPNRPDSQKWKTKPKPRKNQYPS